MGRKSSIVSDRARQLLAQEAARIIVDQGIQDYRTAKNKAALRLGMTDRGSLPGNSEVERAVTEHLRIFGRESHVDLLRTLREAALLVMEKLSLFTPRLVGPVLHGTAAANSPVNLHVFADSSESVAMALQAHNIVYRPFERRLKCRRDRSETFAAFRFACNDAAIEATVFPIDGMRQAPISPVNGRPMQRADRNAVLGLLRS